MPNSILDITNARKSRWGIRSAKDYVDGFSGCLSGGACPTSLLGVSGDQWAACMKRAANTLTYSDERTVIKKFGDLGNVPEGAILVFDNVLTTTRKDRDGDILESSGGTLDLRMPLLWQHLSIQPIGTIVNELRRSKSMIQTRFAIADTELGRDSATLVKFGALRVSHGFQPKEYEPLYDEKDRQTGWRIKTWDCYEASLVSIPSNIDADILASYEKSFEKELDGIRSAFGRDLLKSAAVIPWAKTIYDARKTVVSVPVEVKGYDSIDFTPSKTVQAAYKNGLERHEKGETGDGIEDSTIEQARRFAKGEACSAEWARKGNRWWGRNARFADEEPGTPAYAAAQLWGGSNWFAKIVSAMDAEDKKSTEVSMPASCKCGAASKGVAVPEKIKMYGEYHLDGSFEHVQSVLSKSLKRHLMGVMDKVSEYTWCFVIATFEDSAIVGIESRNYEYDTYRLRYEVGSDGPAWEGKPSPVEMKVTAEIVDAAKSRDVSNFKEANNSRLKATGGNCKCPECGYESKMSDFLYEKEDGMNDEKKFNQLQAKMMAELLKDDSRMDAFYKSLKSTLEARNVAQEWETDGLRELVELLA